MVHLPVMTDEVLGYLLHKGTTLVVDATVGAGGHAAAILDANPMVRLVGVDRDRDALREAGSTLKRFGERVRLVHANYADAVASLSGEDKADGFLADLGVSSLQIDRAERGFSHASDGPLDMRMSGEGKTAAQLLHESDEHEILEILKSYGEVTRPSRIAREIHTRERQGKMNTTQDLRVAIDGALKGAASPRLLSKVFQAIRIATNDELGNLKRMLNAVIGCMNKNGRIVVISYHSLEDRVVKEFFKRESTDCLCPPTAPVCTCGHRRTLEVMTRRVVKPSSHEIERNQRARSAKLRAARVV